MDNFWGGFEKKAGFRASKYDDALKGIKRHFLRVSREDKILKLQAIRDASIGAAVGGGVGAASAPKSVNESDTKKKLKAGLSGAAVGAMFGAIGPAMMANKPGLASRASQNFRAVRARASGVASSRASKKSDLWKSFQDAAERMGLTGKEKTRRHVDKAYKRMASKHHPDKGGKPEDFMNLKKDYEKIKSSDWFKKKGSRALAPIATKASRYGGKSSSFVSQAGKAKAKIKDWFLEGDLAHQLGYTNTPGKVFKDAKNITRASQYGLGVALPAAAGAGAGAAKAYTERDAIENAGLSASQKKKMLEKAPSYVGRMTAGAAIAGGLGVLGSRSKAVRMGLNKEKTKLQRAALAGSILSPIAVGATAPIGSDDSYKRVVNKGQRAKVRKDLKKIQRESAWLKIKDKDIAKAVKDTAVSY